MIRSAIVAAAAIGAVLAGCATMPTKPLFVDDFTFMEEVEGERAIAWVKAQNERSLGVLTANSRFETMRQEALTILNNKERLPLGARRLRK